MVTGSRPLYGYKDQDSVSCVWLQRAGLCMIIESRTLYDYREQDYIWLQEAGLCIVTRIRTLYHVYGYREQDTV